MLNCGCIMCDMCMNKPFVGFAGKNDGKCPVCESTVFKEQSKTKIGGMMLRYKVMARGAAAFGAPDDLLTTSACSGRKRLKNGTTRT
jgi:hypothetical protein